MPLTTKSPRTDRHGLSVASPSALAVASGMNATSVAANHRERWPDSDFRPSVGRGVN
jgi:hypothetical protein